MGTEKKLLSQVLREMGFWFALDSTETTGGGREQIRVGTRTPYTLGRNQGVVVVYDEEGRPFIIRSRFYTLEMERVIRSAFPIEFGAYVPHSNDGGDFMRTLFPDCATDLGRMTWRKYATWPVEEGR